MICIYREKCVRRGFIIILINILSKSTTIIGTIANNNIVVNMQNILNSHFAATTTAI